MLEKCKYYNDSQTACSLMVDDLVLAAVSANERIGPFNDWGYQLHKPNSLYRYFEKQLLEKFPEINGTFFIPLQSQHYLDEDAGYIIKKGKFDSSFNDFVKHVSSSFDFAFHGIKHTYYEVQGDSKNLKYEFNHLNLSDIPQLKEEIDGFERISGIKFKGGKFPGYRGNEFSFEIIERLGFLWWTSFKGYLNYNSAACDHRYIGKSKKIIDIPLTFTGDALRTYFIKIASRKNTLRQLKFKYKQFLAEKFLQYLYENQLIITIQEHFQNQRTDGKRQKVNIYDDISSLDKIYSHLRGADIWHTTTNELAQYLESYDNTVINKLGDNEFCIQYNGRWDSMFLSFYAKQKTTIRNKDSKKEYKGVYKNKHWIYNRLPEGNYEFF